MNYWIFITKKKNWYSAGFEDDLMSRFNYDSDVQDSKNISKGDIVFIALYDELKAIAKIDSVASEPGFKRDMQCPECYSLELYERTSLDSKYKCKKCENEFEMAISTEREIVNYTAAYSDPYYNTPPITNEVFEKYQLSGSNQSSICRFDAIRFIKEMEPLYPSMFTFFYFIKSNQVHISPYMSNPEFDNQKLYMLPNDYYRSQIVRSIIDRRGEQSFRNALIEKYGPQCMISGCSELSVLDASYINSDTENRNDPGNGLLLRSDIHLLFAQDLIGIEPHSLIIHVPSFIKDPLYKALDGCILKTINFKPWVEALNYKWNNYKSALQEIYGTE